MKSLLTTTKKKRSRSIVVEMAEKCLSAREVEDEEAIPNKVYTNVVNLRLNKEYQVGSPNIATN